MTPKPDRTPSAASVPYTFDAGDAERRAARTLAKPSRDDYSLVRVLARDVLGLKRERDDLEQRLHERTK
jgi:hypothetical protein